MMFEQEFHHFKDDISAHRPKERVVITSGMNPSMQIESCVLEAKEIFSKLCPGELFLPYQKSNYDE